MTSNKPEKVDAMKNLKATFGALLWWRVDKDDLHKQIQEYQKLKITQSARGISFLLILFSNVVTIGLVCAALVDWSALLDVTILLVLGVLIYFGKRWAMIAAMIFWTLEKGYSLWSQVQLAGTNDSGAPFLVVTFVWWLVYMKYFYLAVKVEGRENKIAIH